MKTRSVFVLAALLLLPGLTATAAVSKHGAGFGFDAATMSADFMSEDLDFTGYTVFGRIGATDNWGVLVSYRDMEDDEDLLLGEEDTYTQAAVAVTYLWRPDKVFRPQIKFGMAWVDLDAMIPGFLAISDSSFGFNFGGGFEAGSQRVAFVLDYDLTFVELFDEDVDLSDLMLGVIFKF